MVFCLFLLEIDSTLLDGLLYVLFLTALTIELTLGRWCTQLLEKVRIFIFFFWQLPQRQSGFFEASQEPKPSDEPKLSQAIDN
mgnify:CR=1 FL=1